MNEDPVLIIEDDDVDMEDVLVIEDDDDDDDGGNDKVITAPNNDKQTSNSDVIIVTDKNKNKIRKSERSFIRCLKSNDLMDKIVKSCLSMNSSGMPRVIEKSLLPLYRHANNKYKESASFRRLLKKTLKLLVRDPDHKFLHIKTLCEELKSGRLRRKVPFVTLATNLKQSGPRDNIEIKSSSRTMTNKHAEDKRSIIVTKNSIRFGVINVTKRPEYVCEVDKAENNKQKTHDTVKEMVKDINTNNTHLTSIKESSCSTINGNEKTYFVNLDNSDSESLICFDNDEVIVIEETEPSGKGSENSHKENNKTGNANCSIQHENSSFENENDKLHNNLQHQLLIPQNQEELTIEEEVSSSLNMNDKMKISKIEEQIAIYKSVIADLEVREVTNKSYGPSAYVQCSKYKQKVLDCYKELCAITGNTESLVKRHEIRLHVAQGHPSGPAKRLEDFLNDSIDSTGSVAFPDFNDVLQCVLKASIHDGLGWNRQQIFQEATTLFRHCGQALRKRRQKREFKDLLSLVPNKALTDDPAEKDPLLLAKLEENKHMAKIKEEEILEKYVYMENAITLQQMMNPRLGNRIEFGPAQDSSDSDSESEPDLTPKVKNHINITCAPNQYGFSPNLTNNKAIPYKRVCASGESSNSNKTIPNSEDCEISASSNNNLISPVCGGIAACSKYTKTVPDNQDLDYVLVVNGSCNLNDIQNYVSCTSNNAVVQNYDLSKKADENEVENIDIKKEPLDVQSMLDELGDNFECTVFDIEDPFLVIEISSDGFSDDDS